MVKIIAIGDPHFQVSNILEVDLFIDKIEKLVKDEKPDLCVILGDLLHTHERLHTTALNKAYEFVEKMRNLTLTYVLVGNHDMCLGKDIPVLMWDGTIKLSQDVKINDELIGDDGKKCKVVSICSGKNELYKIDQLRGDSYVVTKNHLLTFKCGFHKSMFWNNVKKCWTVKWIDENDMTLKSKFFSLNRCKNKDEAELEAKYFKDSIPDISSIDISIEKYLTIPKNVRDRLYCYRTDGVYWPSKDVSLDPYILGMWLGDGCKRGSDIDLINKYNLINNKHISSEYLCNDENTRLQLLAGFIDAVGTVTRDRRLIRISQSANNIHLIDEFAKLSRSLGFSTHIETDFFNSEGSITRSMSISGNIEKIPIILEHKKCLPNGIDTKGRKCADKLKSGIKVTYIGIGDYYGFEIDNKSKRFLLGDFTVTHNCNNQIYLTDDHWMNGMKEWENVVVVDKVKHLKMDKYNFVFCPYVYPGRFEEALNTGEYDWKEVDIIFAHQEFAGCKMGAIISVEGDKWSLEYPNVISGHIHSRQTPQKNIYYCGSAMQHAFGESEENIIPIVEFEEFEDSREYKLREVDLDLPRKKIVYMDISNIDTYDSSVIPEADTIKLTVSGVYDEFKAFKKTGKYKELIDSGVKVIFKPKKLKKEKLVEDLLQNQDSSDFKGILNNIISNQKNSYLMEVYELVVNNNEVNEDDIMFI